MSDDDQANQQTTPWYRQQPMEPLLKPQDPRRPVEQLTLPQRSQPPPPELTPLELMRVAAMPEIERLTGLSHDTITTHYRHLLVKTSPRRIGMRIRDVLSIAVPRDGAGQLASKA
jgi:hypothetical protein